MENKLIEEANNKASFMAVNAILSTQKDPMDIAKENAEYERENADWQAEAYMEGIWRM